ncbi:hypothetical protein JTE90_021747 [Oedothorax gibbosus]|uniref:Uncharacterized protein n=1 Tax=Oedothorax gibbosus TaxID=931172 RepID=A0AAV6UH51_9ARAC|nr:hypothetical protein JTE90_021747 [Oedothorax gibbosus]
MLLIRSLTDTNDLEIFRLVLKMKWPVYLLLFAALWTSHRVTGEKAFQFQSHPIPRPLLLAPKWPRYYIIKSLAGPLKTNWYFPHQKHSDLHPFIPREHIHEIRSRDIYNGGPSIVPSNAKERFVEYHQSHFRLKGEGSHKRPSYSRNPKKLNQALLSHQLGSSETNNLSGKFELPGKEMFEDKTLHSKLNRFIHSDAKSNARIPKYYMANATQITNHSLNEGAFNQSNLPTVRQFGRRIKPLTTRQPNSAFVNDTTSKIPVATNVNNVAPIQNANDTRKLSSGNEIPSQSQNSKRLNKELGGTASFYPNSNAERQNDSLTSSYLNKVKNLRHYETKREINPLEQEVTFPRPTLTPVRLTIRHAADANNDTNLRIHDLNLKVHLHPTNVEDSRNSDSNETSHYFHLSLPGNLLSKNPNIHGNLFYAPTQHYYISPVQLTSSSNIPSHQSGPQKIHLLNPQIMYTNKPPSPITNHLGLLTSRIHYLQYPGPSRISSEQKVIETEESNQENSNKPHLSPVTDVPKFGQKTPKLLANYSQSFKTTYTEGRDHSTPRVTIQTLGPNSQVYHLGSGNYKPVINLLFSRNTVSNVKNNKEHENSTVPKGISNLYETAVNMTNEPYQTSPNQIIANGTLETNKPKMKSVFQIVKPTLLPIYLNKIKNDNPRVNVTNEASETLLNKTTDGLVDDQPNNKFVFQMIKPKPFPTFMHNMNFIPSIANGFYRLPVRLLLPVKQNTANKTKISIKETIQMNTNFNSPIFNSIIISIPISLNTTETNNKNPIPNANNKNPIPNANIENPIIPETNTEGHIAVTLNANPIPEANIENPIIPETNTEDLIAVTINANPIPEANIENPIIPETNTENHIAVTLNANPIPEAINEIRFLGANNEDPITEANIEKHIPEDDNEKIIPEDDTANPIPEANDEDSISKENNKDPILEALLRESTSIPVFEQIASGLSGELKIHENNILKLELANSEVISRDPMQIKILENVTNPIPVIFEKSSNESEMAVFNGSKIQKTTTEAFFYDPIPVETPESATIPIPLSLFNGRLISENLTNHTFESESNTTNPNSKESFKVEILGSIFTPTDLLLNNVPIKVMDGFDELKLHKLESNTGDIKQEQIFFNESIPVALEYISNAQHSTNNTQVSKQESTIPVVMEITEVFSGRIGNISVFNGENISNLFSLIDQTNVFLNRSSEKNGKDEKLELTANFPNFSLELNSPTNSTMEYDISSSSFLNLENSGINNDSSTQYTLIITQENGNIDFVIDDVLYLNDNLSLTDALNLENTPFLRNNTLNESNASTNNRNMPLQVNNATTTMDDTEPVTTTISVILTAMLNETSASKNKSQLVANNTLENTKVKINATSNEPPSYSFIKCLQNAKADTGKENVSLLVTQKIKGISGGLRSFGDSKNLTNYAQKHNVKRHASKSRTEIDPALRNRRETVKEAKVEFEETQPNVTDLRLKIIEEPVKEDQKNIILNTPSDVSALDIFPYRSTRETKKSRVKRKISNSTSETVPTATNLYNALLEILKNREMDFNKTKPSATILGFSTGFLIKPVEELSEKNQMKVKWFGPINVSGSDTKLVADTRNIKKYRVKQVSNSSSETAPTKTNLYEAVVEILKDGELNFEKPQQSTHFPMEIVHRPTKESRKKIRRMRRQSNISGFSTLSLEGTKETKEHSVIKRQVNKSPTVKIPSTTNQYEVLLELLKIGENYFKKVQDWPLMKIVEDLANGSHIKTKTCQPRGISCFDTISIGDTRETKKHIVERQLSNSSSETNFTTRNLLDAIAEVLKEDVTDFDEKRQSDTVFLMEIFDGLANEKKIKTKSLTPRDISVSDDLFLGDTVETINHSQKQQISNSTSETVPTATYLHDAILDERKEIDFVKARSSDTVLPMKVVDQTDV